MKTLDRPWLVLASSSPRRREILARAGFRFRLDVPPEVEERQRGKPGALARFNARMKCRTLVVARPLADGEVALGADTVVVLDARVLGKPRDRADAEVMLEALQGRGHRVVTGLHLIDWRGQEHGMATSTRVELATMNGAARDAYIASGEADGKAGGYGIQGRMGVYVERISGCYFNVVGLSPAALRRGLVSLGHRPEDYLSEPDETRFQADSSCG